MLDRYVAQVRLLLSVLPDIARETVFALKGGTAINLFYRDMPRLSVDIDLAYLPVADRQSSLDEIDEAFNRIATAITERNPRVKARRIAGGGDNDTRIMVSDGSAQIKIETSPVTRGAVYPTRTMVASETVTEQFGFVETNVLAFEDLFGLIGLPEAGGLPAVRWKLINLEKLKQADPEKHAVQRRALENLFE